MQHTALILSGGRGSRLGGQDKGLIKYHQQPLVERALDMLLPTCKRIIISANRNQEHFRQYGYPVISDEEPGYRGPLMGISSAMTYLQSQHSDLSKHWLLTLPCDMPNVPQKLFEELLDQARHQQHPVITKDAQGKQYLLGLFPLSLHNNLKAYLSLGKNKVADWVLSLNPIVVSAQPETLSFHNINSKEDLNGFQ